MPAQLHSLPRRCGRKIYNHWQPATGISRPARSWPKRVVIGESHIITILHEASASLGDFLERLTANGDFQNTAVKGVRHNKGLAEIKLRLGGGHLEWRRGQKTLADARQVRHKHTGVGWRP